MDPDGMEQDREVEAGEVEAGEVEAGTVGHRGTHILRSG
jgi:hypothetical protein